MTQSKLASFFEKQKALALEKAQKRKPNLDIYFEYLYYYKQPISELENIAFKDLEEAVRVARKLDAISKINDFNIIRGAFATKKSDVDKCIKHIQKTAEDDGSNYE